MIGAIHEKFCNTCNRIRLTSEGFVKLCLYSGGRTGPESYAAGWLFR
ncbi:hypothetical protein [Eubacterium ramulus]